MLTNVFYMNALHRYIVELRILGSESRLMLGSSAVQVKWFRKGASIYRNNHHNPFLFTLVPALPFPIFSAHFLPCCFSCIMRKDHESMQRHSPIRCVYYTIVLL